jgi:hypothetical protein
MKRVDDAVITGLSCLVFACGGRTTGANMGAPGDAGMASRVEGDGASSNGLSTAGASGDEGGPPPELTHQPTVWIGETDRTVTFPAGFDGGDPVPYQPDPTPPEKVVLILNVVTNSVTGTITFGDNSPPAPPVDPKQDYPPKPTMRRDPNGQTYPLLSDNWTLHPYAGFSYSLVSSALSGNLLNLAFVPSELWRDWCAIQDSTPSPHKSSHCECDAGSCRALSSPVRRFDLTVNGNTMQGELSEPGLSALVASPAIRLQRVP